MRPRGIAIGRSPPPGAGLVALWLLLVGAMVVWFAAPSPAGAVEAVRVRADRLAIDLLPAIQRYPAEVDRIAISTAPGADGIVRRIEVRAREAGSRPEWFAFALTNESTEQMDRLLVAPHYRLAGSGVLWPDLGAKRIRALTASHGIPPEREETTGADVFLITLDPGSTVTFVAELETAALPQLTLWEPDAYTERNNSLTLYRGIVIGIAALLALFLSVLFLVKVSVVFPAAALLAWSVLGIVGVDFGFWQRLVSLTPEGERILRAGLEAVLAGTLALFLFAHLNLNRWHTRYSTFTGMWVAFSLALIALATFDAPMAAGIARIAIAVAAVIGFLLILSLAIARYDRAIMLLPTWALLLAWCVASGLVIGGNVGSEVAPPALLGGLVLIVMLIGFTVMQGAFAGGSLAQGLVTDQERKALALMGSGEHVFDWDATSDRLFVAPAFEQQLLLKRGALEGPVAGWLPHLHALDRDRFTAALDTIVEARRGRLRLDLRFRATDGQDFTFHLQARPVADDDGRIIRVVGTLSDVTDRRNAEERLLQDAVRDSLTGLPNRALFLDRLDASVTYARAGGLPAPWVIMLNLDRFKAVNESVGLAVADSILLALSRRLSRMLKPQDTLARMQGDGFAIVVTSETMPERVMALADLIRRAVSAPLAFGERELIVTASVGVAGGPTGEGERDAMLTAAELAVTQAKRLGGDTVVRFDPAMRGQRSDRLGLETDLRRALDRREMKLVFQPIVRLEDRTIAGFEALLRWDHPRLGRLPPSEFIALAEETGIIVDLGIFALDRAAQELTLWQRALPVDPPIFASVNISSRQLFRRDLIHDVKGVLARNQPSRGTLKLELTESLVMENPEFAARTLESLRDLGAGLSLDDFGTGYSSLAYLQRFPFDTIKIDQSFVRQSGQGERPVILRAIVAMGRDLGMQVVAEGIETEGDTVALAQLGCEYGQGYAFGEPMSPLEARRLLGVGDREVA